MKKLIYAVLILGLMLCPVLSFAAGTTTVGTPQTIKVLASMKKVVPVTITADASDGSIVNGTLNPVTLGIEGWYLYTVETDPGTTAPTDNYDLVINDANGFDVSGGLLANRSTSVTQLVNIGTATHGFPVMRGNWTLAGSNNSVNSATVVVYLTFVPE